MPAAQPAPGRGPHQLRLHRAREAECLAPGPDRAPPAGGDDVAAALARPVSPPAGTAPRRPDATKPAVPRPGLAPPPAQLSRSVGPHRRTLPQRLRAPPRRCGNKCRVAPMNCRRPRRGAPASADPSRRVAPRRPGAPLPAVVNPGIPSWLVPPLTRASIMIGWPQGQTRGCGCRFHAMVGGRDARVADRQQLRCRRVRPATIHRILPPSKRRAVAPYGIVAVCRGTTGHHAARRPSPHRAAGGG